MVLKKTKFDLNWREAIIVLITLIAIVFVFAGLVCLDQWQVGLIVAGALLWLDMLIGRLIK